MSVEKTPVDASLGHLRTILPVIRESYTNYLNDQFPNAQILEKYQGINKGYENFDPAKVSLAEVIQGAYPVLQYSEDGKPKDNRMQYYIYPVDNFVKDMKQRKVGTTALSKEEQEVKVATKIYGALSALENSIENFERKRIMLQDAKFSESDMAESLSFDLEYIAKCEEKLFKALKSHQAFLVENQANRKHISGANNSVSMMLGHHLFFKEVTSHHNNSSHHSNSKKVDVDKPKVLARMYGMVINPLKNMKQSEPEKENESKAKKRK